MNVAGCILASEQLVSSNIHRGGTARDEVLLATNGKKGKCSCDGAAAPYTLTSSGLPSNTTSFAACSPTTRTTMLRLFGANIFDPFASRMDMCRWLSFHAMLTRMNSPFRKLNEVPSSSYQENAPFAPG